MSVVTAQEIINWVTTVDTTQLDFAVGKFVQTCRDCRQLGQLRIVYTQPTRLNSAVESRRHRRCVFGIYPTAIETADSYSNETIELVQCISEFRVPTSRNTAENQSSWFQRLPKTKHIVFFLGTFAHEWDPVAIFCTFSARQHAERAMLSQIRPSLCLSVYPSVTRVDQLWTVEATVAQSLKLLRNMVHPEIPLTEGAKQGWGGEKAFSSFMRQYLESGTRNPTVLLMTYRKLHMRFRLAQRPMTMDDLELDGVRPPFFQIF